MRSLLEEQKLMDVLASYKVKCKCGHTMYYVSNREKMICNHCGRTVYKNKKMEFKSKLDKERRKSKWNLEH